MKIGVLLQNLNGGGAEKILVKFANYLAENGHDVTLFLINVDGQYASLISTKVNIVVFNKSKTLFSFSSLYKSLNIEKIDFLYTSMVNTIVLSIIVTFFVKTKLIIRESNNFRYEEEKRFFIKISQYTLKFLYKFSFHTIAISNSVKRDILKYTNCHEKKIQVIYNPVFVVDNLHGPEIHLNSNRFNICLVSRFTKQKNFKLIYKTISTLKDYKNSITFHFFGEGDDYYANLIKEEFENSEYVIFHGFNISYYSYAKVSDLFLHIPLWEGLGNSVLEMYSSNIPMILSDIDAGYAELIPKDSPNVDFVNPNNLYGIVSLILKYYNRSRDIDLKKRTSLGLDENLIFDKYLKIAIPNE